MRSTWCALATLFMVISGCDPSATRVDLYLGADSEILTGATSLTVTVINADGRQPSSTHSMDRLASGRFWTELSPIGGDATRTYELELDVIDGSGVRARQRVRSGYVAGQALELLLRFDAACIAELCSDGETCVEGACVDACASPTPPGAVGRTVFYDCEAPPFDGGMRDGGMADAGATDCVSGPDLCVAGDVVRCVAGVEATEDCAVDCDAAASSAVCREVLPSNISPTDFGGTTLRLTIPSGEVWRVDTSPLPPTFERFDGSGASLGSVDLDGGRLTTNPLDTVAILAVAYLTVEDGATLQAVGTRPFVLFAEREVTIAGLITVHSDTGVLGAGGGTGGLMGATAGGPFPGDPGVFDMQVVAGGAGGSYGTIGGDGGYGSSGALPGGTSRTAATFPILDPDLIPLTGGSGGGLGGTTDGEDGGEGGHGGGALQITANRLIVIRSTGTIDASGGPGRRPTGNSGAGAGGGSGGAILLEAFEVRFEPGGFAGANGGGGGAGGGYVAGEGDGLAGAARVESARGGNTTNDRNYGGAGNDFEGLAIEGRFGAKAGGGGGGGGRIRINANNRDSSDYLSNVAPTRAGAFSVGAIMLRDVTP